ncbi:MAG: SAM-dependent methyltransferase, partial [Elusimicrobiota bacterium]
VLIPGGRLVLIVPAHKALFGSLDERVGHCRRYSKEELVNKLRKECFSVEKTEFMNFLGAVGWFLNFKILKRKRMPKISILFFDKLIPLIALSEKYIKFPFSLSLLCVAKAEK